MTTELAIWQPPTVLPSGWSVTRWTIRDEGPDWWGKSPRVYAEVDFAYEGIVPANVSAVITHPDDLVDVVAHLEPLRLASQMRAAHLYFEAGR